MQYRVVQATDQDEFESAKMSQAKAKKFLEGVLAAANRQRKLYADAGVPMPPAVAAHRAWLKEA